MDLGNRRVELIAPALSCAEVSEGSDVSSSTVSVAAAALTLPALSRNQAYAVLLPSPLLKVMPVAAVL